MIGLQSSFTTRNGKPLNQNQSWMWHKLSRAWPRLHEFAPNSDWLIAIIMSLMIGQRNYFGFGFASPNQQPL